MAEPIQEPWSGLCHSGWGAVLGAAPAWYLPRFLGMRHAATPVLKSTGGGAACLGLGLGLGFGFGFGLGFGFGFG